MYRVLVVNERDSKHVLEYVVIPRDKFGSIEQFLTVVRREAARLSQKYALPNNRHLELFEGGGKSVDSFFRMFPELRRSEMSIESEPEGG